MTDELKMQQLRICRNIELNICDWTQANDSPLSDSKKAEWATYRQKLRDFPTKVNLDDITYNENNHTVGNITWPNKPE
mgnify:CR=1 FL=1|tara:strand:+ start:597 stop:830 length:234 start_codon:yes stop_codon:yes gene_type:complete